jgi:hypothetical protein
MRKVIIYKGSEGGVSVVIPAPEYLLTHTIEDCIAKDVPAGTPYKIIDISELPEDKTFRDAWEYQE